MSHRTIPSCILLIAAVACLLSCGDDAEPPFRPTIEPGGVGDACNANVDCRSSLACIEKVCSFRGDTTAGAACELTGECAEGLFCDTSPAQDADGNPVGIPGPTGVCSAGGHGSVDAPCGGTGDCEAGLVCVPRGLSGVCAEGGTIDIGAECASLTDCYAGLSCSQAPRGDGKVCASGAAGLPRPFGGVDCATDDEGPARVYFEVPGGDDADFFRLPYPNDIRLVDGRPNLSGFPTPGDAALGFDIVQRYIDAIEAGQTGFGLKPTVFFRFSERFDFGTVDARGESPTMRFVDITPDSPTYNRQPSLSWQYSTGGQKYICGNWMSVTSGWGTPLNENTTYAVILSGDIRSTAGDAVVADEDFKAMMAPDRPSGRLATAWDAYQPLRDWAEQDEDIDAADILAAAVFTTGDPRRSVEELRAPARETTPQLSGLVACDGQATSPCDDGLEGEGKQRGCFAPQDGFTELQGTLSLPVFQTGTAPYLESGGEIGRASGAPTVGRREEVCTAITVPQSAMPENGWPLLIHAHGTGGDYRTHVPQLTPLVNEITWNGESTAMVVMGWDQVQHANRRGESELPPEPLVYNYANPVGARGNFLQGAADFFAVVAWAENFHLSAQESPTGEELRIDPTQIYVMAHSQGGATVPLALPYEPGVHAALLSGAGSGLSLSLLDKTSPNNARQGLSVALQDPGVSSAGHPVLSLIQAYFDPVDPHSYAPYIVHRQIEDRTSPSHVFHAFGLGDTYTPPSTLAALARGLRVNYIEPLLEDLSGVTTVESPASGNLTTGGLPYTALGRQYAPDGYDGHFVVYHHPTGKEDLRQFFGSAILSPDGIPQIGE